MLNTIQTFTFYKTPIPTDQEDKTALAKKLANKYNLSILDYSRCLEGDKAGPDKDGQKDR